MARVTPATTTALEGDKEGFDLVVAFTVVHEMPSAATFFAEAARAMKPGARLLLAEPSGHIRQGEFDRELALAARNGLSVAERPPTFGGLGGC
jgi:SAM-dependent methyltransferase